MWLVSDTQPLDRWRACVACQWHTTSRPLEGLCGLSVAHNL